jgi:hypothetical protein
MLLCHLLLLLHSKLLLVVLVLAQVTRHVRKRHLTLHFQRRQTAR